jgi:hypothetical protein
MHPQLKMRMLGATGQRTQNVAYWHKADMPTVFADVRFRG